MEVSESDVAILKGFTRDCPCCGDRLTIWCMIREEVDKPGRLWVRPAEERDELLREIKENAHFWKQIEQTGG